MSTSRTSKLIRDGEYVVEVEVLRIQDGSSWAPYLSAETTKKLEDARAALKRGDLKTALSVILCARRFNNASLLFSSWPV
jgi:hypothetical protein